LILKFLHSQILASVLLVLSAPFLQARPKNIPAPSAPVIDRVGVLSHQSQFVLETLLRSWKNRGVEMSVLITASLEDYSVEEYSLAVAEAWKLGAADTDKGLLLLVAPRERKVRIEVGQGLEGDLPDAYAKRIIEDVMLPEFRSGDYDRGVLLGVQEVIRYVDPLFLKGQSSQILPKEAQKNKEFPSLFYLVWVLFFLLIFWGGPRRGRFGRVWTTGYMGGSWGGMGGGGGGSWGGGGGGFSGGGSSGSW
jgi:uncharacterized protein